MKPTLKITEFDELIGSSSLQMMKALLPFLEPSMQQWAAFYIQMQELQNAMALFQTPGHPPPGFQKKLSSPEHLLEELRPYGGPAECVGLDQMKHAIEAMKLYQKFSDLQKRTQGPLSPLDLAKEMLPPEQAAMFQTYSSLFQNMDLGSFDSSHTTGSMDFGFFS